MGNIRALRGSRRSLNGRRARGCTGVCWPTYQVGDFLQLGTPHVLYHDRWQHLCATNGNGGGKPYSASPAHPWGHEHRPHQSLHESVSYMFFSAQRCMYSRTLVFLANLALGSKIKNAITYCCSSLPPASKIITAGSPPNARCRRVYDWEDPAHDLHSSFRSARLALLCLQAHQSKTCHPLAESVSSTDAISRNHLPLV